MNDYFYVCLSRVTNHVPASTWDNTGVSTGEIIFMFAIFSFAQHLTERGRRKRGVYPLGGWSVKVLLWNVTHVTQRKQNLVQTVRPSTFSSPSRKNLAAPKYILIHVVCEHTRYRYKYASTICVCVCVCVWFHSPELWKCCNIVVWFGIYALSGRTPKRTQDLRFVAIETG